MLQNDYENLITKWCENPLSSISDVDTALNNFRVLFAYNSNKIENAETTLHDTREIFENGKVVGYTGELRTLYEIENQKKCYEFLRDKIVNKEAITEQMVLETHKILMSGCYDESRWLQGERPGEFKHHDYIIGDSVGSNPEEVETEILKLCKEINTAPQDKALTVAAYFHLKFESIHPFADGNGRVGRTLMNYYLMTHGLPPTVIYDDDKKTYYMALAVFDKSGDIKGFEQFLKEETVKTWTKRAKPEITLGMLL